MSGQPTWVKSLWMYTLGALLHLGHPPARQVASYHTMLGTWGRSFLRHDHPLRRVKWDPKEGSYHPQLHMCRRTCEDLSASSLDRAQAGRTIEGIRLCR